MEFAPTAAPPAHADDSYDFVGGPLPESPWKQALSEQLRLLLDLLRWIPIASAAGILAGSASALLLVSLEFATNLREAHRWLILLRREISVCNLK